MRVDLNSSTIRLRPERSKNKRARLLKLRGEMLAIIERAAERRDLAIPFVFHRDGQPIGDFRKTWKKAFSARLGAMLVHDLRQSAVRNMIRGGLSQHVAMAISGHRTATIFDRYDIIDQTDLDQAAGLIDTYVRAVAQRTPKVAVLRRPAAWLGLESRRRSPRGHINRAGFSWPTTEAGKADLLLDKDYKTP